MFTCTDPVMCVIALPIYFVVVVLTTYIYVYIEKIHIQIAINLPIIGTHNKQSNGDRTDLFYFYFSYRFAYRIIKSSGFVA